MSAPGSGSELRGYAGRIAAALGIAAVAAALYWPIRAHEWVAWDDFDYITRNPHIALGLSSEGISWALSSFHLANWFPLTWLSWMLDYERAGFDASTFLTTNLALHALDSGLLYLALLRLTGSAGRSAFVALVFAVHPLHVESVAWAAARKDPLSAVFFMLALWLHGGDDSTRSRWWIAACFALGFAAKPTIVTLPLVLLLLDDWPLRRTRRADDPTRWDPEAVRRVVRARLPLVGLAFVFGLVTVAAQRAGGTVQDLDALTWSMRIKAALIGYVDYLRTSVWPVGLGFFYPHPGDATSAWAAGAAGVALLVTSGLAVFAAATRPYLAVGWFWFLGMLLPAIGLVQVGAQARADRYMYLPLIGLTIAVAWGIPDLLGRWRWRRLALGVAAALSIGALALRSTDQIATWRDSVTLLEHGLRVTRDNYVAHAHLGGAYLARGRTADAIAQYEAALELVPDYEEVANNLAWLLATAPQAQLRDPPRALLMAQRAVHLLGGAEPSSLDTLAAALAANGRFAEAAETAERAERLAREAGDAAVADELHGRLRLYESDQPFVDR